MVKTYSKLHERVDSDCQYCQVLNRQLLRLLKKYILVYSNYIQNLVKYFTIFLLMDPTPCL